MAVDPKQPPVIKKKVQPYPFAATVTLPTGPKPVEVLFLGREGLIAKLDKLFVHVGEYCQIQFELPVSGKSVMTQVRVLKTYDKALDPKVKQVERLAEFHFEKLTEDHRNSIFSFISAIGQKSGKKS